MTIDLTGKRFGRLFVLGLNHKTQKSVISKRTGKTINRGYRQYYECICDCGKHSIVLEDNLKMGYTKSCGCIHSEVIKERNTKHGLSYSRINKIYRCMKQRCYNKKTPSYKYYGGRGITICDKWKDNFTSFYNWAIKNGYKENLTIDRVDVNGNYCPENCRWATYSEQARNKRNNHLITFNGETHCIADWADILDVPYKDVVNFIKNYEA